MVYDLESMLKHAVKAALEQALKKTTLYDVLFDKNNEEGGNNYRHDASKKAKQKSKGRQINYPKCAYPGCDKNRFARGLGFCGEHYKMHLAGEAKSAEEYRSELATEGVDE